MVNITELFWSSSKCLNLFLKSGMNMNEYNFSGTGTTYEDGKEASKAVQSTRKTKPESSFSPGLKNAKNEQRRKPESV